MNFLDKVIGYFSPERAFHRAQFRKAADLMASYSGAYPTRASTPWSQSESIGGLPHLNLIVQRNLRDRARSLVENNVVASSMLDRAVENIVGDGFQFQMASGNPDYNKKAEDLMNNWFGIMDFYGSSWVQHQRLAVYGLLRDGDIGGALLSRGQVQLVEGDYISSPFTRPMAFLHDGVEVDKFGRIVQFWVMQFVDLKKKEWRPVKARDFLFLANMRRRTQYRGEPCFAQCFDLFDSLAKYIDAVTMAQQIAACLAIFIKMNNPAAAVSGLRGACGKSGDEGYKQWKIAPGMIQALQPGEEIQQITPQQPGNDFSQNIRMFLRIIGLTLGMPLEYALLDYSGVSGQTAKGVDLRAQLAFERWQKLVIDEYLTRLVRWRLCKFVKEGLLEPRADGTQHIWHPKPWPYLDRVKELQAAKLAIDIGLSTEQEEILSRGGKPDKIAAQQAKELARKRKTGIPILHSTMVQEIGVKAPASNQESVGTPDPGGEPPDAPAPADNGGGDDGNGGDDGGGEGGNREAA